jgi:peptidyl-prolyl cis-trans isomerase B (cyclophilin B)
MHVRLGLIVALALVAAGCGGGGGSTSGTTTGAAAARAGGCATATPHKHPNGGFKNEHLKLDPAKTYKLVFTTNCGDFTITLDQKSAPNAVASLVSLAQRKYFDDTFFHRIAVGFVIQGGDPTGTGTGGPGYETHDKVAANASYVHGVVAMAKTSAEPAGTAGSQFFVVTGQDAGLTPDYAIVGKVTSGLDVVDKIGKLGDPNEQPTVAVVISKVTVQS